jgi:hypothetical protein
MPPHCLALSDAALTPWRFVVDALAALGGVA